MRGSLRRSAAWRERGRPVRVIAFAALIALIPAACDDSKEATVDVPSLTRAAASMAISVSELVERYAAELPTGDSTEDVLRMRSIFEEEGEALDFEAVGSSFAAAASASRMGGNGKAQAARQLVAAARLAILALSPSQPGHEPSNQAMLASLASSLEPQLNTALGSTYDFAVGLNFPTILVEAVSYAVMIASYNYVGRDGSHPIRERMQAFGMEDPPAEFVDAAGNLRLPQGSEPAEAIARFETWRVPAEKGKENRLWRLADAGPKFETLWQLFEPATDRALK